MGAKRYYDKAVEADQDAAIPVFLALAKLCFDFGISKIQDFFSKQSYESVTEKVNNFDFEGSLVHYFGDHWDVIAITLLAFVGAFVMAWRRQNALLYRRLRAAELQRLQDMQVIGNSAESGDNLGESVKGSTPTVQNEENVEKNRSVEDEQTPNVLETSQNPSE